MNLREQRSMVILEMLMDQWEENYVRNKAKIQVTQKTDPDMEVWGSDPVLVIGAGPSLEKNKCDIDPKRYSIAACDKTVPILMEQGIVPDTVFALNAAPTDVRRWVASANDGITALVVPCGVHPDTYKSWRGPIKFINAVTPTALSSRIERELGLRQYPIGSNAGTFAYTMMGFWNYKRIGCIGLDFSFLTRGEVISRYEVEGGGLKQYNILEMTDINGDVRFLDLGWFDMAQAFQEKARDFRDMFGTRTINCTEGGINYSEDCEAMTLKEFNRMTEG